MKLSRRKFFGASAGAVVAGPSAIKEASAGTLRGLLQGGLSVGYGYGGDASCVPSPVVSQAQYLTDRRKDLERIISGQFNEWESERLQDGLNGEQAALANVEALRSLSHSGRVSIGREALVKFRKAQRIAGAKRELAEVVKGLRSLK